MNTEETLFELPEGQDEEEASNPIEKPKRKASEKQLAALAAAREKRKTKMTALDKAAVVEPPSPKKTIGRVVRLPEAEPEPIILKKPKLKRSAPKPTIIQFESEDSSSGSDSDGGAPAPTIIIRNGKKKAGEPNKQATEKPVAPAPPAAPEPPRQYIRRAY